MAALEAFFYANSKCDSDKTSLFHAFDGALALLIGSVEGQGVSGSLNKEGHMFTAFQSEIVIISITAWGVTVESMKNCSQA
jgi:hypothetical protein